MSTDIKDSVVLLPIGDDLDRLAKIFEDVRPSRVHILYNENPRGIDEKVNKKIYQAVRELVEEHTLEYDDIEEKAINFYEFDEALKEIFRIVYKEKILGNEIYANLVGGTRIIALALTYACSLAGTGQPVYYGSKKSEQAGQGLTTTGVLEESFELYSIPAFNIENLVPDNEVKSNILTTLLEMDESPKVHEMLEFMGEIEKRGPSGVKNKKDRSNKIKKYSGHCNTLVEAGLVKGEKRYELTNVGKIAANLIEIRNDIDGMDI